MRQLSPGIAIPFPDNNSGLCEICGFSPHCVVIVVVLKPVTLEQKVVGEALDHPKSERDKK